MVVAADANDSDTVKRVDHVGLGSIKGNQGDQNYELRRDVDLNHYRTVTIWCKRFGMNFGTAHLGAVASASR